MKRKPPTTGTNATAPTTEKTATADRIMGVPQS
jgi:hypothetical protein